MAQNSAVKPKHMAILLGSRNDWSALELIVKPYTEDVAKIEVHVISCHRNPLDLLVFVARCIWDSYDAVICAGGKAFALPGVLNAFIRIFGGKTPVIGVALGTPGTEEFTAAMLSIKQIPGEPVIMDDASPFWGPTGFHSAIELVIAGKLPAEKERQKKPAKWNLYRNFK